MSVDDLAQAFASVDEEMRESEPRPTEATPFHEQFSTLPSSTSQAEAFPPGTTSYVYSPGGNASGVYSPVSASISLHSSMMVGHATEFNRTGANFQVEDHGKIYQPDEGTWQSGPGTEPVNIPPSSSVTVPQGDVKPEFHTNLESGAPRDPQEGNLLV